MLYYSFSEWIEYTLHHANYLHRLYFLYDVGMYCAWRQQINILHMERKYENISDVFTGVPGSIYWIKCHTHIVSFDSGRINSP